MEFVKVVQCRHSDIFEVRKNRQYRLLESSNRHSRVENFSRNRRTYHILGNHWEITMADFRTQFEAIGQAFVKHYYGMFDNAETRSNNLIALYLQEQCFQTFEGSKSAGVEQIKARLTSLTFQKIQRSITSIDCQPLADGVLVVVMGQLKTDDDMPQSFQETFILRSTNNNFFITNNVFRLVLHHN